MLFGQMSTADPSRSPIGTESAWAYTHLPRGVADDASADQLSAAVDVVLEKHARFVAPFRRSECVIGAANCSYS